MLCGWRITYVWISYWFVFFFQAEDGIRDLVRSRGLGDVYKRQRINPWLPAVRLDLCRVAQIDGDGHTACRRIDYDGCLLYTSDAADERSSVDLGGRRIIKKKNKRRARETRESSNKSVDAHTR